MELSNTLPFVVHLDDVNEPADLIDAMLLGGFVAGALPVSRSMGLQRVRSDARLLPAGVTAIREARTSGRHARLAVGDGWALRATRWYDGTARLTVTAVTDELAEAILDDSVVGAIEPEEPDDKAAPIRFWHQARNGASSTERSVAIQPWAAIRSNYSTAVARAFDQLMELDPSDLRGRLLLLHGPPGTGKTTALRALAHAWRDWCGLEFVIDPDHLMRDTSYLVRVLLGERERDHRDESRRWRLLVLEDCDELIRSNAKQSAGPALGRLLNLTDGLVGQGLDVLVCVTTNEELSQLHPAVVRPGRCVAQIHVGRLPRAEAIRWLGRDTCVGPDGATLAELCALRGELDQVQETEAPVANGMYL
jgi:uncharacterized protein DUF5925/ATPase family protein associated with various cellular activities (AAA)